MDEQIHFLYTDIADATTEMIGALLSVTEKYGKEHIERCARLSCCVCVLRVRRVCRVVGCVRNCWLTLAHCTPHPHRMSEYLILTRLKTPSSLYKNLRYPPTTPYELSPAVN